MSEISLVKLLRWLSVDLTDDKSAFVQVMTWCCLAASHYLSQCWPSSVSPYGVTRSHQIKLLNDLFMLDNLASAGMENMLFIHDLPGSRRDRLNFTNLIYEIATIGSQMYYQVVLWKYLSVLFLQEICPCCYSINKEDTLIILSPSLSDPDLIMYTVSWLVYPL